ncbi:hypothetical protein KPL39_16360 [Clostridium gasigenes]|uniref:hypothetical protein n=1 Tax=Clostridium gasigenes TaxID=94869 RepID=UPI001C0D9B13|nr:hypothetical protein [Clostridium gasigenes]MBU3137833.1 hypothetical protein [Clostridium gasigenes]
MSGQNTNTDETSYRFDTPNNYLKSEYSRLNYNNEIDIRKIDLDKLFKDAKNLYGVEQTKLFESDKILFKELKKIASYLKVPIDEQERSTFWIMNRHCENVEKILKQNNISVPKNITIGTLPLPDLNAFVSEFSDDRKLMVLNRSLIEMLYLMGRITSSCFSITDEDNKKNTLTINFDKSIIDKRLKTDTRYSIRFLDVLMSYFTYQKLPLSEIYFEEDNKKIFSESLYSNGEFFIVAHEYAHIMNNDLYSKTDIEKKIPNISPELYTVVTNWIEEFEADKVALEIALVNNSEGAFGLLPNYLGVEFLFACFNIIEEIDMKINNFEFSETHPSAQMRIESLRVHIENTLPNEAEKLLNGSEIIPYVLNTLWNENKDAFYMNFFEINNNDF